MVIIQRISIIEAGWKILYYWISFNFTNISINIYRYTSSISDVPRWVAFVDRLGNPPGIRKIRWQSPKGKRTLLSEGAHWIIAGYWGRLSRKHIPSRFRWDSCPIGFRLLRTKLTRNFPLLRSIGFWNSQILNHILHWASNFKINNRIYHTDYVYPRISTFHLFRQLSLSAS